MKVTATIYFVQDLIHGAPVGKPAANKALVTAVYADQVTEKETVFTRIIHGSSSEHKINNQVKTLSCLQKYLKMLGLYLGLKSCNMLSILNKAKGNAKFCDKYWVLGPKKKERKRTIKTLAGAGN